MQLRILPLDAWWWQVGGPLEFPSGCWLIAKKRGHRSVIHVPRYMFLCPGRSCLQARGHINMVEVVVDTVLEGVWAPGLVSEVLLRGEMSGIFSVIRLWCWMVSQVPIHSSGIRPGYRGAHVCWGEAMSARSKMNH